MRVIANIIRRITGVGAGVASVFLAAIMLLIVAVVVLRPFNTSISGSYEMIELLIVVAIAFAFAYTAMHQGHIVVTILVSRFSPRTQAILGSITWFLSFLIWGWIFWAGTDVMLKKWLREVSYLLHVPFLPFRIVWVFGLLLFSLMFLINMFDSLKKAVRP